MCAHSCLQCHVSVAQQSELAIHIHLSRLPWISFPFRSPQSTDEFPVRAPISCSAAWVFYCFLLLTVGAGLKPLWWTVLKNNSWFPPMAGGIRVMTLQFTPCTSLRATSLRLLPTVLRTVRCRRWPEGPLWLLMSSPSGMVTVVGIRADSPCWGIVSLMAALIRRDEAVA